MAASQRAAFSESNKGFDQSSSSSKSSSNGFSMVVFANGSVLNLGGAFPREWYFAPRSFRFFFDFSLLCCTDFLLNRHALPCSLLSPSKTVFWSSNTSRKQSFLRFFRNRHAEAVSAMTRSRIILPKTTGTIIVIFSEPPEGFVVTTSDMVACLWSKGGACGGCLHYSCTACCARGADPPPFRHTRDALFKALACCQLT